MTTNEEWLKSLPTEGKAKVIANDTYYWCHILNDGVCLDDCVDCCEEWLKQEHKE